VQGGLSVKTEVCLTR